MTTANVVDVSEWQPTTIDFADLKNQGIKAVIVRLGRGTTRDQHVVSHIANAKAAGLIVHGYHYYEGADGEVAWSVKNAQDLGLKSNAYYFLDMEGDITGSWSDIFRGFYRNWLQAGFKVGLYCSLSKYGLFDEKELTSNHIYRWIADWDVDKAPGVADIWQFNCSTGLGSYTNKLDKDVDLKGKLIEPISETTTITDADKAYPVKPGAFVGFAHSTTELQGGKFLVSSPDGKNKIPKLGPDGSFIFNQRDFDKIWADTKKRIHLPSVGGQIKWADIQDKPNLVTEEELAQKLPDLSAYALKSELPNVDGFLKLSDLANYAKLSDLNDYVKKADIPAPIDTSDFATKMEVQTAQSTADAANRAARNDATLIKQANARIDAIKIPDVSGFATNLDLSSVRYTAESASSTASSAQEAAQEAQSAASGAANTANSAYLLASNANQTANSALNRINKIDTSNLYTSKEPSAYPDGSISYEVKSVAYLGINRSGIASELQNGSTAIVTTKSYNGMVRQTAEIIDSQVPATFIRNGYQSSWSTWYISQLTAM